MENNQISKQSENFNRSLIKEVVVAAEGKMLKDSSDEEIKQKLRYAMVMIGCPADKVPDEIGKIVLLNFLKKVYADMKLEELQQAFDYAVEKITSVELSLYAETFSPKFVANVLTTYLKYKKELISKQPKQEDQMINLDRGLRMFELIKERDPELWAKIRGLGEEKKKEYVKREYTEAEQIIQDIFKEFDQLHNDKDNGHLDSIRNIEYNGQWYNQEKFLQMRLEELNKL